MGFLNFFFAVFLLRIMIPIIIGVAIIAIILSMMGVIDLNLESIMEYIRSMANIAFNWFQGEEVTQQVKDILQ